MEQKISIKQYTSKLLTIYDHMNFKDIRIKKKQLIHLFDRVADDG